MRSLLQSVVDDPAKLDAVASELSMYLLEMTKFHEIVTKVRFILYSFEVSRTIVYSNWSFKTSHDLLGCLTRLYHNQTSGLVFLTNFQRQQRSNTKLGRQFIDSFCSGTKYDRMVSTLEDLCQQYVDQFLVSTGTNIEITEKPKLILDFSSCKINSAGTWSFVYLFMIVDRSVYMIVYFRSICLRFNCFEQQFVYWSKWTWCMHQ